MVFTVCNGTTVYNGMQQNTETCDHCVNGIEKDRDRMKQNGSRSQILMCIYCAFTYVYTSIPPFSKSVRGRSGALVPIRVECWFRRHDPIHCLCNGCKCKGVVFTI